MRQPQRGVLQRGPRQRADEENDRIPAHRGFMRSRSRAGCGERLCGVLVVLVLSVPAHGRRFAACHQRAAAGGMRRSVSPPISTSRRILAW